MSTASKVRKLSMAEAISGRHRPGDGARRARSRDGRGHRQVRRHLHATRPARQFGPERIMDTPISEDRLSWAPAIGAAAEGLRPISELMSSTLRRVLRPDLQPPGQEHLHVGGACKVPVVITTGIGGGFKRCRPALAVPVRLFAHVPGLKVVWCRPTPTTPRA